MPFAPVDGGQLHYEIEGSHDLPVLVLSNSLGADLSMWNAQIPVFTQRYQALRYDAYGHGGSTFRTGKELKFESLGKSVLELIDHLGLERVYFCGLSVGGMVGQWLALNAGDRLIKVALCNTGARIGTVDGWNARIATVNSGGIKAISQAVLDRWFTPPFHQREPAKVDHFRKILEATPAGSYVATCAAIRDCDLRNEVPKIRVEILVIAGTRDTSTPPEDGRDLAARIPGSRYVELDAAHLSNVELAGRFSEEVLNFITG